MNILSKFNFFYVIVNYIQDIASDKRHHGVLMFTRDVSGKYMYWASKFKSTLCIGIARMTSFALENPRRLEVKPNLTLGNLFIRAMASTAFPVKKWLQNHRSVQLKSSKIEKKFSRCTPCVGVPAIHYYRKIPLLRYKLNFL